MIEQQAAIGETVVIDTMQGSASTCIFSLSTRIHPAMARSPCRWSFEVENTVNTLQRQRDVS